MRRGGRTGMTKLSGAISETANVSEHKTRHKKSNPYLITRQTAYIEKRFGFYRYISNESPIRDFTKTRSERDDTRGRTDGHDKLITWTPPQDTTLSQCHSNPAPSSSPLARSPCPCHCNTVCLFVCLLACLLACKLLGTAGWPSCSCRCQQGAEWGFESHVRTSVNGWFMSHPLRETMIPVRCSCEHPVMWFALLKSWSETPSYVFAFPLQS